MSFIKVKGNIKVVDIDYRLIVENAEEGIAIIQDEKIIYANPRLCELTGYTREEILGFDIKEAIHPDDLERVITNFRNRIAGKEAEEKYDFRVITKNGEVKWFHVRPVVIEIGGRPATMNFLIDVTDRKDFERRLSMSEKNYRELVENVNSIVLRWKPDGTITFINEYGAWFFEYKREELIGKNVLSTIVPKTDTEGRDLHLMINDIAKNPQRYIHNENENVTATGRRVFVLWRNKPIFDENGELSEILSIGSDITDKKRIEKELMFLATHDALTGIKNRGEFERILSIEIGKADRYNEPLALILFDIDNFKKINDSYGHSTGDKVLKRIASTVSGLLRNIDTFARWGGEEFVILLPHTLMSGAVRTAEKIRCAVEELGGEEIPYVTVSLGVTLYRKGETTDSFLVRADRALYEAKGKGKNCVVSLY